MSLRDQLLDLLHVGPASAYALEQDTCQPMHLVEMALSRLVASGHVRRIDNVYSRVDPPPAPPCTTVHHPAPPPPKEPDMTIECKKCGVKKADSDMVIRAGKPSRLCKACFAASLKGTHGPAKPKAPKAKAAKPTALREVVAKHTAKPNRKEDGSHIAKAIAELQLRRAVIDQAIEALTRAAA